MTIALDLLRAGVAPLDVAEALDAWDVLITEDGADLVSTDTLERVLMPAWADVALAVAEAPCAGCGRLCIGPAYVWYEAGQVVSDCGLC